MDSKKKGLLLIGLLAGILLTTNVFAIWLVSISSTATYEIYSLEYGGLVTTQDFSGQTFDSLSGAVEISDKFIFQNEGNPAQVNITISTERVDISDNCTNWQNDCEYSYFINASRQLQDGSQNFTIGSGTHEIQLNINCVQYACPQSFTPSVLIEKMPI